MKFAFEISATRFKKIFEKNIFPNGISYFLKHDSTRLKMSKNPFLNTFNFTAVFIRNPRKIFDHSDFNLGGSC